MQLLQWDMISQSYSLFDNTKPNGQLTKGLPTALSEREVLDSIPDPAMRFFLGLVKSVAAANGSPPLQRVCAARRCCCEDTEPLVARFRVIPLV